MPSEENPALGMRALRLCFDRPQILTTQLRALYRASVFGNLSIMIPMVTSVWEVQKFRRICREVTDTLKKEGISFDEKVRLGIMIETPAAALVSDSLAEEADFFSCGTNDLTQYTLACDRYSPDLQRYYDPCHPAVLRLIRMACESARRHGIPFGICGELAGDPAMTEAFLDMGADELSVAPGRVLPLRRQIREMGRDTSCIMNPAAGI